MGEVGNGDGEVTFQKTMGVGYVAHWHERLCARGWNEAERMRFPGHLGLIRLDLVFYQRRSTFASELLVLSKKDNGCATG